VPEPATGSAARPEFTVRVADERDVDALARLRRDWLQERAGRRVEDAGFEAAFGLWWRTEQPRRTFWLAEVGSERAGWTAVGSINVVEIVSMPSPGSRGGRIGQVGNAFVLATFADRGVPRALLAAVVDHARQRRYRRLMLAPTSGSASFYRRAGFAPAEESILVLDPQAADPGA
jgi:GNAT superfamily N-acetyltransferase